MVVGTINDAVTMAGGEGALLAGRYRIVKPLGQGGMGSVWLAEDSQLDNKLFAVKMLPSVLVSNKRAYRQLKDEALVAMKLTHPNIVTLRAFEENDGNPFLVMDYIEGQTLDDYLAEEGNGERGTGHCRARTPGVPFTGGLPEEEVIRILRPIAEALDYAHKKGVVHRDVKPGNVMIASDGTPYILDFGIAREIQETMTRVTGKLSSGTLLYMSPEQLRGQPPKPAQDIYSFAATVYECIKGEPPFCRGQVEHQILNEEPEPLPEGTRFCASVKAGLAKSPEERPMTCAAVLDGVVPRRVAEPRRGGGAGKAIGVLALLAALGAGGYYGWVKHEEALREKAAEVERVQAEKKEAENRLLAESERIKREAEERLQAERKALEEREKRAAEERERLRREAEASQRKSAAAETALAEQEARQREVARLAELRVDIGIKVDDAKEKMSKIAAYRGEPDGFAAHIGNADEKWKVANAVERNPSSVAEAEALLRIASEAESTIARELRWLETNKAARDGAKSVEAEIVRSIAPDLERFKANDYARVPYRDGDRLRKDGNDALARGDFPTAKSKLDEAKKKLSEAVAEAKRFCIDTHLKAAAKWLAASRWQPCVDECNTVLGWDASNAEAKRLKADAEKNLVPSAEVKVLVGGAPLAAGEQVKIGSATWTTPIVWGSGNIKEGGTYGGEAEYTRGGKRYVGTLESFTVNWRGPRTLTVALKEYAGPKHGDRKTLTLPGGATMEMIYVGPGEFMMGSNNDDSGEKPVHRVRLTKGYWLGKFEVTQKQWQSVMGKNPSKFSGDNKPVECVSWNDCQKFIGKIQSEVMRQFGNYKASLPTEAQWEFACRAGMTGDYAGNLDTMAWYGEHWYTGGSTHPVGTKNANAWGFYDMHGNVCEWCQDRYDRDYYSKSPVNDPCNTAAGGLRVMRGGAWDKEARHCRSAQRYWISPHFAYDSYGFRLCCSAGPRE